MAYAVETDLRIKWGDELVDLTAYDNRLQLVNSDRIAAALDSASATMNGYLAGRYSVPLALAPEGALLLKNVCCDLAMGQLANTPGTRSDIIADAEKRALDFMRDVASAKAAIPVALPPNAQPEISPNEPMLQADSRQLSRDRLRAL